MSIIHWNVIRNKNVLKFLSNNVHILNELNIIFLCIYILCVFCSYYIYICVYFSIKFPLDFEILSCWNLRKKNLCRFKNMFYCNKNSIVHRDFNKECYNHEKDM